MTLRCCSPGHLRAHRRSAVASIGFAAVVSFAAVATPALAAVPLPDLAPPRTERVELRWQTPSAMAGMLPGAATRGAGDDTRFHEMSATIPNVEHRFDLRAWRGRVVRIDLVMPPLVDGVASTTGIVVQWDGGIALQPGRVRPGERATVFSGRVDSDMLLERLRYTLVVDSRFFDGTVRFRPAFELEAR